MMGMLDSILGQVTGQSTNTSGGVGGASSLLPALMSMMAAESAGGAGTGQGGLGGMLGGLMGGSQGGAPAGGLGGMLGGGGIAGGLGQLVQQFEQNGHGAAAQSWVGNGANQPVSPDQVNQALGSDTIDRLASYTGMSQGEVSSQLSQLLPQAIHGLTPNGRMPTADEASQCV